MKVYVYDSSATSTFGLKFTSSAPLLSDASLKKSGEVLVQVKATGLNPVDYKLAKLAGFWMQKKTIGQDFSGIVSASKSSKFPVGSKVFGQATGCLSEYIVASESEISLKPESMNYIEAASLPTVTLTSLQGLLQAEVKEGSSVLVVGCSGGCGLAGIQIARSLVGASGKVGGICGTSNLEKIQKMGVCDVLVDYKTPDILLDENASPLRSLGDISCCYDTVTSPDSGDSLGGKPFDAALKPFFSKSTKIAAINGGAFRWIRMFMGLQEKNYNLFFCKRSSSQLEAIAGMVAKGDIKATVDSIHAFTPEGCAAAYEKLHSRRAFGKVCIDVLNGSER